MRASRLAAVLAVAACATLAAGCAGDERPFRLGVLTDCQGPFHAFEEAELSGVELPLVERGAHLRGPAPTDGVTDATAGGRKVELVRGCAETGEFAVFLEDARRLVEKEHVDAIVGGNGAFDPRCRAALPDRPVRGDVLGRAGGHAAQACGQHLPLRDRLRAAHGRDSGHTPTAISAGVARASRG